MARRKLRPSNYHPIVLFSDWHVEERVTIDGPGGVPLNRYSPAIAVKRKDALVESTAKVFSMYADLGGATHERPGLTLGAIGDFVTGDIHDENRATATLHPQDAADLAYRMLLDSVTRIVRWVEPSFLDMVCQGGNHGRTTKKNHAVAKRGFNLETTIFERLRDAIGDSIGRTPVRWHMPAEQGGVQYVDLPFGRVGRFMHGEEVNFNGGIGGLFAPLARACWRMNTEPGAAHALTFGGHHHTFTATHDALFNGSLIGHSALGRGYTAQYEPPCQAMGVISPAAPRGFLATHRLAVE